MSNNGILRARTKLAVFERSGYQNLNSLEEALDFLLEVWDEEMVARKIFECHAVKLMNDGERAMQTESEEQCLYIARSLNAILDVISKNLLRERIEKLKALRNSLANKWREVKKEPNSLKDFFSDTKEHLVLTGTPHIIIKRIFCNIEEKK